MKRIGEKYANRQLEVIWIGFQDRKQKIKEYIAEYAIASGVAFDEKDGLAKKLGIKYGAGVVIVDSTGIIKKRLPKGFSGKALSEAVQAALGP